MGHEQKCRLITAVMSVVAGAVIAATTSGCGLMGVRQVDAWGLKVDFAEGLDFHVGANQVDNVDDRRGVSRENAPRKNAVQGQGRGAIDQQTKERE